MKFLSGIFAIYILLLTLVPTVSKASVFHIKQNKKTCCSQEQVPQKKSNAKDCCRNACNPFMSCCNGCALITQLPAISPAYRFLNNQPASLTEVFFPNYLSDHWNPPKTV